MSSPRRVPSRYFQILRDALRQGGTDTVRLLNMAGIAEEPFNARDGTLSALEVDAFIAAACRLTGRHDLGFELGRRIKVNSHDLLGYGMLSCSNVDQFLGMASRHYHLMTETWSMSYRRWSSGGEAVYTPRVAMPPESVRFYLEVLAVTHQNQVQMIVGRDIPAYDIYLSMPPPEHVQRYFALVPARFHFHEGAMPGVRVVMPAQLLDISLALSDPDVVRQIEERCNAMGQKPPRGDVGWVDYVTMVLRESRGEQVTLDDLARRVNVSARTIDRHLKKEGLGFRELSDKVRFERACELLAKEAASITDVALQLGFSDTANFSRAFRRVIGVSPSEHQRRTASSA